MGLSPLAFSFHSPIHQDTSAEPQSADCEPPCRHWANPDMALASEPLEEVSEANEIDNP